jgi:hypothetical protein
MGGVVASAGWGSQIKKAEPAGSYALAPADSMYLRWVGAVRSGRRRLMDEWDGCFCRFAEWPLRDLWRDFLFLS